MIEEEPERAYHERRQQPPLERGIASAEPQHDRVQRRPGGIEAVEYAGQRPVLGELEGPARPDVLRVGEVIGEHEVRELEDPERRGEPESRVPGVGCRGCRSGRRIGGPATHPRPERGEQDEGHKRHERREPSRRPSERVVGERQRPREQDEPHRPGGERAPAAAGGQPPPGERGDRHAQCQLPGHTRQDERLHARRQALAQHHTRAPRADADLGGGERAQRDPCGARPGQRHVTRARSCGTRTGERR